VVSSAHLFQLPRHSDHHANASRPYHQLRTLPGEAPLLPAGYPAMMLTALVPPLFFQRVDPLLDAGAGRSA
jgi:alkane 1-monooxygenase